MNRAAIRAGGASLRAARSLLLELLFPIRCSGCGAPSRTIVCPACTGAIRGDTQPFCPLCLCERRDPFGCRAHEPAGAAWSVFEGTLRSLVLALKYDARGRAAVELAAGLAAAASARSLLDRADLLAPVPPDPGRLRTRGYHPAAWLARSLGRACGRPVVPDLLVRVRSGPSQTCVSPAERRVNVARAFAVARPDLAAGRRVLLVDDVVTTGSTAAACLEALEASGARQPGVVAAARAFERGRSTQGLSFLADR